MVETSVAWETRSTVVHDDWNHVDFFLSNWAQWGYNRAELRHKDGPLLETLADMGRIKVVPRSTPKKFFPHPFVCYQKGFSGVFRGELSHANHSLYVALDRMRLLEKVPLKPIDEQLAECNGKGNELRERIKLYNLLYRGITRGKFAKANPNLYRYFRDNGLLDMVPTLRSRFGDLQAYYVRNLNGLTRGQVAVENRPFYDIAAKEGFLKEIPTKF